MFNNDFINESHNHLDLKILKNSKFSEQNNQSYSIEQTPILYNKSLSLSNSTNFQDYKFNQTDFTIDCQDRQDQEFDNYQINIDGVNKRRALFSLDMKQNKHVLNQLSDLSNQLVESPIKLFDDGQNKYNYEVSEKSSVEMSEKNNKYFKQQEEDAKENSKNPNSQIFGSLSQRNRKQSKNIQQIESSYIANQQDYKAQNYTNRLMQMSQMMQSAQQDSRSEDSGCQTKAQSSALNNQSLMAIAKFKSNRNQNKNQSKISRRWSNHPTMHDKNQNNEETSKAKNYFIILSYVKKFIKQCVLKIAYKDVNLLDLKHFKMIGDASYFTRKEQFSKNEGRKSQLRNAMVKQDNSLDDIVKRRENLAQNILITQTFPLFQLIWIKIKKIFFHCKLFSKLLNKKIILPNSIYVIIWDFIIILIMLFHLIVIPVKTCFDLDMNGYVYQAVLYFIPAICFAIDIIIAFNTGIYEFGVIVVDQKIISRAYWKNKFPYHVFLILTLLLNYRFQNILIEFFAIYLRLNQYSTKRQIEVLYIQPSQFYKPNQIQQRMNKVNQHFQITLKLPKLSELLKLITLVLFVAHLCGCGFHYVGQQSYTKLDQQMTWIISQNIENSNWIHRYIYSMYFAIVTMVTIGYGDVYPTNIFERVYVVFMTLFSCGIFAYAINTIGNIFLEQNYKQKAFQQKLFDIQKYLQSKSINKEAQIRVFKYLEYLNEQTDEILTKGFQFQTFPKIQRQAILSECSQDLREEILKDYYGKILLNLRILQNNFSTEFIQALSVKMKEKRFGPGEVIIQQGNRSKNLYFLSNGDIEYNIQNGSKNKQILALQNMFRVFDFRLFITETVSPYSIRSTLNTTLAFFTFEDFISTLKEFNLDYEKYCMIRDQFQYNDRFDNQCLSCGQYGHDIQGCSQLHYNVNKSIFLQKISRSTFQPRGKIENIQLFLRKKNNCLRDLKPIKTDLKILRWRSAQDTYDDYADINVFEISQLNESDRDFFLRCPKIKNQIQKNESDQIKFTKNFFEGCEMKSFDEFGNEDDIYNSSSESDQYEQSDYYEEDSHNKQSVDTEQLNSHVKMDRNSNLQPAPDQNIDACSINIKLSNCVKVDKISNLSHNPDQNLDVHSNNKKRQSNDLNKPVSRQSFTKNNIEEITPYKESITSLRNIKDKKQNQNLPSFLPSVKSLEIDDLEKNQKFQNQGEFKSMHSKKKYQQSSLNLLEEKHEGGLFSFKKQLIDVLQNLDNFQQKDYDKNNNNQQENLQITNSKNIIPSSRQIFFDPNSIQNDPKDLFSYLQQQLYQQEKLKNYKFKHQRRDGLRKTTIKQNILRRNDDRDQMNGNQRLYNQKEGDYEIGYTESNHIFGVLQFNFDKMKEFVLYYPKNNYTSIVKSYKKIQAKQNQQMKHRKTHHQNNYTDLCSQKNQNTQRINVQ